MCVALRFIRFATSPCTYDHLEILPKRMYKVEILSDRIEQEAINRRRRLDQERKERIFNPRVRMLGVRYFLI